MRFWAKLNSKFKIGAFLTEELPAPSAERQTSRPHAPELGGMKVASIFLFLAVGLVKFAVN